MQTSDFDFTEFLAEFGHGATNQQAGERIRRLVAACIEHSGKGKFVLTLDLKGGDGLVEIKATLKTTEPQPGSASATYYATEAGALVTENPRQANLPLRTLKPTSIRGGD